MNRNETNDRDELFRLFWKARKPSLFLFIFYVVILLIAITGQTILIINAGKLFCKENVMLIIFICLFILNAWYYFHDRKKALKDFAELETELRQLESELLQMATEYDDPTAEKMMEDKYQELVAPLKKFLILELILYVVALLLGFAGVILRDLTPSLSLIFLIMASCLLLMAAIIFFIYKKRRLI